MRSGFTVSTNSTFSPPKFMFGTSDITVGAGITLYTGLFLQKSTGATESLQQCFCPSSLTIQNLAFAVDTAPGAGETTTATLRKNGVDTVLTCTISGAVDLSAFDTTHSVAFAAGDFFSIAVTSSGGSASGTAKVSGLISN